MDELGGPDNVAEITGCNGRVIKTEGGQIQYELLNLTEKKRFMDGEKGMVIISEAAFKFNGISLQSDHRVRNQRGRVHVTLELPWSDQTSRNWNYLVR